MDKKFLKCRIMQIVDLFLLKLEPVFENIDAEAKEHGNNYVDDSEPYSYSEYIVPGDLAEQAIDPHFDLKQFEAHMTKMWSTTYPGSVTREEELDEMPKVSSRTAGWCKVL